MLGILSNVFKIASRQSEWDAPPYWRDHEMRKGDEMHRRTRHELDRARYRGGF